ncbi:hypothetical protein [Dongia sp.]|uniref:hypothetical protein n=1 Tax=Dongia sp. TaxID=1977262 RepID=UPI0035B164E5
MSVSGGMFSIIQQGQISSVTLSQTRVASTGGSTNPLTWSLKKSESAIQAYWRLAPEAAAKNAPSVDLVKRLEKLAEGDNKEISAEKLRQAKARLSALRQQIQLAAISNNPRQIKRLAAEAAQLAREVGAAARHLAQGVAAGTTTYGSTAATSGDNAPVAVKDMVAASATRDTALQSLHAIGDDARSAIAEAKGLIALAAQMARSRRKRSEDDDDEGYFRRLQEVADEALAEVEAGQREAIGALYQPAETGSAGVIDVTQVSVSVTTVTAAIVAQYA